MIPEPISTILGNVPIGPARYTKGQKDMPATRLAIPTNSLASFTNYYVSTES